MGNNLSDYNRNGASNVSHRRLFADLPLAFSVHPNTQDLTALTDLDAVKQSVKNLVMTNFTERLFEPNMGSNITALLFEPADQFTEFAIENEVVRVLKEHEPRVSNVRVDVLDNSDRNSYQITIQFNVVFSDQRQETNFYLERTR